MEQIRYLNDRLDLYLQTSLTIVDEVVQEAEATIEVGEMIGISLKGFEKNVEEVIIGEGGNNGEQ